MAEKSTVEIEKTKVEQIRRSAMEALGIVEKFVRQEQGNRLSEFSTKMLYQSVQLQIAQILQALNKEAEENGKS